MAYTGPGSQNTGGGKHILRTNLTLNILAAGGLCLVGAGCAKKTVALNAPPPPPAAVAQSSNQTTTQRTTTPPAPVQQASAPAASRFPDAATRARIDELLGRIQDAYFDYNRHTLNEDAVKTLSADSKELAQIMGQYPDYKLRVEGYCDERGSAEYNIALGEARAKAAKDYLVSAGVSANQLSTISYGKEKQICEEHDEACWQKNRRVHIVALAMNAQ